MLSNRALKKIAGMATEGESGFRPLLFFVPFIINALRSFRSPIRERMTPLTTPFAVISEKVMLVEDGKPPVEVKGGISAKGFSVIHDYRRGWLQAGYLRDAKGVWWFSGEKAHFVSPDADGFRVLDDDYGLDANNLYLENRPVPGADPASFRLIDEGFYFARDRYRLYVKMTDFFCHFDEIDMDTLVINGEFVADKDHLFHAGMSGLSLSNGSKERETVRWSEANEHHIALKDWFAKHHPAIIGWWHPAYDKRSDKAEQIADDWFRTSNAVFFRELHDSQRNNAEEAVFNLVRDANPDSFVVLDEYHAKDASGVYCRWRKIREASPATFQALGGLFGKDNERVYFNGYAVPDADPASFVAINTGIPSGKDRNRVYVREYARTSWPFGHVDSVLVAKERAAPESFQTFGDFGIWGVDANSVYLRGKPKKKFDAASFRFLVETRTNSWACDKNGLYRSNGSMVVAGIDGSRFVKLNDFWGTDGKSVFSFVTGAIQKSIDAATFRVTDTSGGAEDATMSYRIERGEIKKAKRRA